MNNLYMNSNPSLYDPVSVTLTVQLRVAAKPTFSLYLFSSSTIKITMNLVHCNDTDLLFYNFIGKKSSIAPTRLKSRYWMATFHSGGAREECVS
jgi:hypothetical protein